MQAKNVWWMIMVGGMVGAMLVVGVAVAAKGGLPACEASLQTCQTDLATCQTELAACPTFPGDGVDGPALSYTDNNDGTFTDNNTLFMWEKKVAGGSVGTCDLTTNLHGVDSTCTWAQATGVWIAAINAANLGGHNDWRVPNVKELQSLVDYSTLNPAASVPGSTAVGLYWSSTTDAGDSSGAWFVSFFGGGVGGEGKGGLLHVRAVRGGQ